MHIKEIMSQPVVTCPASSMLDAPARLMWEFDCGVIPVVDGEGRLAGVITDRDICIGALTQGKPLHEIPVTSVMATAVVSCYPDDSVEAAEHAMRDNQIHRVPVIDAERRPVGLVSVNDIARQAAHARKSAIDRELVQMLGAICEPRVPGLRGDHEILVISH